MNKVCKCCGENNQNFFPLGSVMCANCVGAIQEVGYCPHWRKSKPSCAERKALRALAKDVELYDCYTVN